MGENGSKEDPNSKEKIFLTNIKNYNVATSVFHFITVATWEVLVLDGFRNQSVEKVSHFALL